MASDRTVYHVVPNSSAEKWLVTQENGGFRKEYRTKEEAVEEAKMCFFFLFCFLVILRNDKLEYTRDLY